MSQPIISISKVSKKYRLGLIGMTTLRDDLQRLGAWLRSLGSGKAAEEEAKASDFWALRDVSFDVPQGKVVGIIGRNGAGKSTLLKILSRITEPTTGEIRMRGRVGSLLEVGTGFHPELSGRDNVYLNGAILGMTKAEIAAKFDEIVAFAEIEKFIDTPVKRYSSGMYVRLAFSIAAHLEPEILIVDEVLAVGDAEFQRKCIAKIESLRSSKHCTILFVSHNLDLIERICDEAVFLQQGRVVDKGPVEQVIGKYKGKPAETVAIGHWVDLSDANRRGSLSARFTKVRLLRADPAGGSELRPGDPLRVEFELDCPREVAARSLAVTFYGPDGAKLVNCDSLLLAESTKLREGRNAFSVSIAKCPLNAGNFGLGLWLEIDPREGPADWISTALRFEIKPLPHNGNWEIPYSDGMVHADFALARAES